MAGIFEASPEGFRAQNMARSAAHLVRELIQNVLDEAATRCKVTVSHRVGHGVDVTVEDDVPGGIRDERLVFTIWMSDKEDLPTKRGRMGRGLKELVSVSDKTTVATAGRDGIVFERQPGGEWTRSRRSALTVESGTVIQAHVKSWKAKDAAEIVAYVKRIRPPAGIELSINGEIVVRRPPSETYQLRLPSVTFVVDEGERKESNRAFETTVELFAEEQPHAYEMGLPIEPIDYPLSIDIGQRVPMREKRDTLLSYYKSELFAVLLNKRIAHIPDEQLKDNYILTAAAAAYMLDESTKARIAQVWTEGKPYATTPLQHSIATGQHVAVVSLRGLPEAVRDIVKAAGQNVQTVLAAREHELCPTVVALSPAEQRFVAVWKWIAANIARPAEIVIRDGHPGAMASFSRALAVLAVYRQEIPAWKTWTAHPLKSAPLSTLIHELSHWKALEESHGLDFHSDAEDVGGLVAAFLVQHADEALAMVQP